ncbi:MAG TPA: hypothetical protein VJN18_07700 [Polyangiaceae bacterium]|nr:hypothetical protein [Polyangiaceae bacterium]
MVSTRLTAVAICFITIACGRTKTSSPDSARESTEARPSTAQGPAKANDSGQKLPPTAPAEKPDEHLVPAVLVGTPCGPNTCTGGKGCCDAACGLCSTSSGACPFSCSNSPKLGTPKNEYGSAFSDSLLLAECRSKIGAVCSLVDGACPNQSAADIEDRGVVFKELFSIRGDIDRIYSVSVAINGIAEANIYEGGKSAVGAESAVQGPDGMRAFYVGGRPASSNNPVMRLRVINPDKTTELARYYLNAFPPGQGWEEKGTLPISYEATIDVPGWGFVEYMVQDSDCKLAANCAKAEGGSCKSPRPVPKEPHLLLPSSHLGLAVRSTSPWEGQLLHVTLTRVVPQ